MTISLEILSERYLRHLELLNYSPQTIGSVTQYLRQFGRFLDEIKLTEAPMVTARVMGEFQSWLFYKPTFKGTARFAATSNRVLTGVRGFFRFLKQEGIIAVDPTESMEYAREPDPLPRNVLTVREARRIIETVDSSTTLGYRDRTILEVLYTTGIRKTELASLKVGDVKLEEGLLYIQAGKGAKDRVAPLGRMALRFLETYIKAIRPELLQGRQNQFLFLSLLGRPMSGQVVPHLIKKHTRLAGVKKHVTCHLWRHTCATHLVQNRANLRHVQEILGHRSLATTERYLSLTITDLKAAHQKYHPREKDARQL